MISRKVIADGDGGNKFTEIKVIKDFEGWKTAEKVSRFVNKKITRMSNQSFMTRPKKKVETVSSYNPLVTESLIFKTNTVTCTIKLIDNFQYLIKTLVLEWEKDKFVSRSYYRDLNMFFLLDRQINILECNQNLHLERIPNPTIQQKRNIFI